MKGHVVGLEPVTEPTTGACERYIDAFFHDIEVDGTPRALLDRLMPSGYRRVHRGDRRALRPDARAGRRRPLEHRRDARDRSDRAAGHLRHLGRASRVRALGDRDGGGRRHPNITYLSRVRRVDDERVALSNQFLSKTAATSPRTRAPASSCSTRPTYDEYRLTLVYERTERRGPVFERLREDVDAVAALSGMQDVFKLRAADIYRVVQLEHVPDGRPSTPTAHGAPPVDTARASRSSPSSARGSAAVPTSTRSSARRVDGLAELLGYEHSLFLLLDEAGRGSTRSRATGTTPKAWARRSPWARA